MAAVQETIDQVRKIDVDQYKYGFETKIATVKAPKGLGEDTVRFISEKKGEPAWMLEWRLESYRRWRTSVATTGVAPSSRQSPNCSMAITSCSGCPAPACRCTSIP